MPLPVLSFTAFALIQNLPLYFILILHNCVIECSGLGKALQFYNSDTIKAYLG